MLNVRSMIGLPMLTWKLDLTIDVLTAILMQDKRKDAVKKVIAAMTVGKDVSSLFTDVVNCMQTENLELKKLVYLYLINYAKSQPDLAILAVNTFVKVFSVINTGYSPHPQIKLYLLS